MNLNFLVTYASMIVINLHIKNISLDRSYECAYKI